MREPNGQQATPSFISPHYEARFLGKEAHVLCSAWITVHTRMDCSLREQGESRVERGEEDCEV
jgi:hypothetical protein